MLHCMLCITLVVLTCRLLDLSTPLFKRDIEFSDAGVANLAGTPEDDRMTSALCAVRKAVPLWVH